MAEQRLVEVYRAKDSTQAHMLAAALEDAGIKAVVEGDLLQGALGELPMGWATAPRIKVEASDAERARDLLQHLEQKEQSGTDDEAE